MSEKARERERNSQKLQHKKEKNLLEVSLLSEEDSAGEAVEGPHPLVDPLVHVPVTRRCKDLRILRI